MFMERHLLFFTVVILIIESQGWKSNRLEDNITNLRFFFWFFFLMALHLFVWQIVGTDQLSPNSERWLSLFLFKTSKTYYTFLDNPAMGLNVPTRLSFAAHPFAQQAKYQFFTPSITHWVKSMISRPGSFALVRKLLIRTFCAWKGRGQGEALGLYSMLLGGLWQPSLSLLTIWISSCY